MLMAANDVLPGTSAFRPGMASPGNRLEKSSLMRKQRILKDYLKMREGNLQEFALGTGGNLSTNPVFAGPKITGAALVAKAQEFSVALSHCCGGSSFDRAHKKAVRADLIARLNLNAGGVEDIAQGNVEILTASGFHLTRPDHPGRVPVGTARIISLTNVASTKLGLNLAITGNVWAVVVERQNADGTWTQVATFTDLRDTVLGKLTPGSQNTLRVCAMAAGNQASEWSMPLSGICT